MSATTISIATHKGGTGKTVTSMALASALARAHKKTLLIDLDPQGHSTLGLGVELNNGELTLKDLFSEPPSPIAKVIKPTHLKGLDIIPDNIRLERVSQVLYMRPKREEILKRVLEPILNTYDFVVMDCPPSLGVLTEAGIAASQLVIVPCLMEARAADGLVDLLELVNVIKGDHFENWQILLTRVDSRKTVTNQAVMAALEQWKHKIFKTSIPQSEPLNQAQIMRTDIFTYDPRCKGALAYQALTKEILRYGK
ncbi:MAG: ParA family protein [Deltaproteobacteria bacterium]|nr:MAG: ParA family protein [Deltaproteobacteria bacterium]